MIGEQIGSYRVVRELGRGGMGTVFLAQHALLDRPAAVKVLLPALSQNQEMVNRFFNEAKAATQIRHPGIVEVYDFGYHDDGSAFLVMEFLEGESLEARLAREGRVSVAQGVAMVRQVCSALAAAHSKGIVHRDLKPDNIFIVPDPDIPGGERIKLLDFGIAKLAGDSSPQELRTRTGAVMGTPMYMAPEQCRGASQLDARADLYSLGCILFRILCGRTPFVGEFLGDILAAHMRDAPPPMRSFDPTLPPSLDTMVGRLLAKNPDDRYASATDLGRDLETLGDVVTSPPAVAAPIGSQPTLAAPAPSTPGTTLGSSAGERAAVAPPGKRRWGLWVGGIGAAVALGGAITAAAVFAGGGGEPPAPESRPVTLEVHSALPHLVPEDFDLELDAEGEPRVAAASVVPFTFSDRSLAMVVLVQSDTVWLGNETYVSNAADQMQGAFQGLVPALRMLSAAGPRDTRRALVTYASEVTTRLEPTRGGDLVAAMGAQKDYRDEIGVSFVAALDEGARLLAEQDVDRRMLVVFGNGQGMKDDISDDLRRATSKLEELDALVFTVGYAARPGESPNGRANLKRLGRAGAYFVTSRDDLPRRAQNIVEYLTSRYLVTFELPPELARSDRWLTLRIRGDERDAGQLRVIDGEPPRRLAAEVGEAGEGPASAPSLASAPADAGVGAEPAGPRVIDLRPGDGYVTLTINRGKRHGVAIGDAGSVLRGESDEPLRQGHFKIIRVAESTSIAKVRLSVDEVRANRRVDIEAAARARRGHRSEGGTATTAAVPQKPSTGARPAKRSKTEPAADALGYDELVQQARTSAKAGQFGKAMRLCDAALRIRATAEAATICGISACNLKNAARAKRYLARLSGSRRGMIRQICLRAGVAIP